MTSWTTFTKDSYIKYQSEQEEGDTEPTIAKFIGEGPHALSKARRVPVLRHVLPEGLWLGISPLRRGGWSIKFVASDGVRLRRALRGVRAALSVRFPRLACDPRKL